MKFYISTFRCVCAVHNMDVFCSSLMSFFPVMLLRYCVSDFEMASVAPIIAGIIVVLLYVFLFCIILCIVCV